MHQTRSFAVQIQYTIDDDVARRQPVHWPADLVSPELKRSSRADCYRREVVDAVAICVEDSSPACSIGRIEDDGPLTSSDIELAI
jgi:hypothetical protein